MIEPQWRTIVQEQSHAVCFSTKAVKQCPRGYFPYRVTSTSDYESIDSDSDETAQQQKKQMKTRKVSFKCMDRVEPEARRLMRQLRVGKRVVQVDDARGTSFTEQVAEPQRCWRPRI